MLMKILGGGPLYQLAGVDRIRGSLSGGDRKGSKKKSRQEQQAKNKKKETQRLTKRCISFYCCHLHRISFTRWSA
ncbi:MAG: hypothetical protein ACOC3F_00925 [Desulfosudaceae bacterium]